MKGRNALQGRREREKCVRYSKVGEGAGQEVLWVLERGCRRSRWGSSPHWWILVLTGDMSTLGKVESCLCLSPSMVRWLKTKSGKSWWWSSVQEEGLMEPREMLQQLVLQTIKSSWKRPSGPPSPSTESHHLSLCLLDTHGMGTPPLPGALHEEVLPDTQTSLGTS